MSQHLLESWSVALLNSWWLIAAMAHSCIYIAIARLILYGYREHSYLYVFNEKHRALLNLIHVCARYTRKFPCPAYRSYIALYLRRAGYRLDIDDNFFIAQQLLFSFFALVVAYLLLVLLLGLPFAIVPAIVAVGFFFPLFKLIKH